MGAWTAPLLVGSLLLAVAGAPKLVDPTLTVGALRSVGIRVPGAAVRVFGGAEALLGVATLLTGARPLAALVAASYAGFSAFLVVALRRGGAVASCGCVGRPDTPPTRSHLTVTAGLAVTAVAATVTGADGVATAGWSAATVGTLAFSAFGGWLVWLVFTALPHLSAKGS